MRGGVEGIWNFANVALQVPHGVWVQREVIAGGLAMLTVRMQNDRQNVESVDESSANLFDRLANLRKN